MPTIVEQRQELDSTITKLIALGENADELNLWISLFDTMDDKQRVALLNNLADELKSLEKTGNT